MKCSELKNRLYFFVENAEQHPQKNAIEKHLSECESCKMEALKIKQFFTDISVLKNEELSESFEAAVYKKIHQQSLFLSNSKTSWARNYMRVAAVALLLLSSLSAGLLLGNLSFNTYGKETPIVSQSALSNDTDFQLFTDNSFTLNEEAN